MQVARPVVEQAADCDAERHAECCGIAVEPLLLQRIAHADQQEVGAAAVDQRHHAPVVGGAEIAVVAAGDRPAREAGGDMVGGAGVDRLARAEQEAAPAGLAAQQGGDEVGAGEVGAHARAAQEGRDPHATPSISRRSARSSTDR